MSDELFEGLEAALAATPDNHALRLHVATLYNESGDHERALDHAAQLLEAAPDDLDAIRIAAAAAEAIGDPRAASYRRLADALSGDSSPPASPPPDPDPPETALRPMAADVPDSVDALLDIWNWGTPAEPEIGTFAARPAITLADVGGMAEVKDRLDRAFLAPMRNPELAEAFSMNLRGGLLLWGPPGCGKTFLAKACAGELGASFYTIGLSDVLDMWVGSSERNLTSIFDTARANAPCLLFFDELDALGHKRVHLRESGSAMRDVVNQFLTELDGAGKDNDGVFVLGATNHPWDIDAALLRPGRFDRMMLVLPPDEPARRSIIRYHLSGRPQQRIDVAKVAARTDRYSGADLEHLCATAAESAMSDSLRTGKVRPINERDFADALREVKPSTTPWLDTARNYAMYSNESGEYNELLHYLKRR